MIMENKKKRIKRGGRKYKEFTLIAYKMHTDEKMIIY